MDTIQAAILKIKLNYLDQYSLARNKMAAFFDDAFSTLKELEVPSRLFNSPHVFHQYIMKVKNGKRDELQKYLSKKGIPSMIYYPIPLYDQEAFAQYHDGVRHSHTEQLCQEVISIPIHTEMEIETQSFIIAAIKSFFRL